MTTRPLADPGRLVRRLGLVAIVLLVLATSGCFRLVNRDTYAIGLETNRANMVVHTRSTKVLYDLGRGGGVKVSRDILLGQIPDKLPITAVQRVAICAASAALCLGADQIGRTLVSWLRTDIRSRGDFWESLSYAGRSGHCFAWTFAPSRNLTHKGIGTSGCGRGR